MTIIGWICIAAALIWILYKVYVAYNSFGGTVMVAVYDAAIYAPPLAAFGLYWVLKSFQFEWSIWIYIGIWVGLTVLVVLAIKAAEHLGDRPL